MQQQRADARRVRSGLLVLLTALAAALLASAGSPAHAVLGCEAGGPATITWDGGAGSTAWTNAVNWSGNRLPTSTDHVCVPAAAPVASVALSTSTTVLSLDVRKPFSLTGGTLTLGAATQPSALTGPLTLGGGTLAGASPRTLGDVVTWTGGGVSGPGTTTLPSSAVLTVQGTATKTLAGRLESTGRIDLLANLSMGSAAALRNGGTLDLRNDAGITCCSGSSGWRLDNLPGGLIRKSAGVLSVLDAPLDNDGTIRSEVGTLSLTGGQAPASASAGTWTAAADAVTDLASSSAFDTGARLAGPGVVQLSAGTAAGPLTVPAGARLTWTGGVLRGPAAEDLVIGAGGTLSVQGTASKALEGRVRNDGTVLLDGALTFGAAGTLRNTGTLTLVDDSLLDCCSGTGGQLLTNTATGVIGHTGEAAGVAVIDVPLDNDGVVSPSVGTLRLSGGSGPAVSSGAFRPGTGAVLEHAAGTSALTTGNTVGGAGTVLLTGGTLSGAFRVTGGLLAVEAGTLAGPTTGTASITSTGRLEVRGAATTLLSGSLRNDGVLDVRGPLTAGSLLQLVNAKSLNLHDGGSVRCCSGTAPRLLTNLPTGRLYKLGAADSLSVVELPVDNDGVVRADGGTLELTGGSGGAGSAGAYGSTAAGVLVVDGAVSLFDPGARVTPGTLTLRSGTLHGALAVKKSARLVQLGGAVEGPTDGSQPFAVDLGGTWQVQTSTFKTVAGTVRNDGVLLVESPLSFSTRSALLNTGRLDVVGNGSLECCFGTGPQSMTNTGTVRKVGAGTSVGVVEVPLDNDGTVSAAGGRLELSGGTGAAGQSAGSYGATSAGTLALSGGTHALAPGSRIVGPGRVELVSGALAGPFTAASGARVHHLGGAVEAPTVTEGTQALVEAGATWTVSTPSFKPLSGVLRNEGTLTVDGELAFSAGGTLRNAATLEMRDAGSLDCCFGTGPYLVQNLATGSVLKTGTTSSVARIGVPLENDGSVLGQSGTLELRGGSGPATSSGDYGSLQTGGLVRFAAGTHRIAPGGRLTGPGRTELAGGVLAGPLTLRPGTAFTWSGGGLEAPVNGTGAVRVDAGAVLRVLTPAFKQLSGPLQSSGHVDVEGSIDFGTNAVLTSSGLLELSESASLECCLGSGTRRVVNTPSGTVHATGGDTRVAIDFDNQGLVLVEPDAATAFTLPMDYTSGILRDGAWHVRGQLGLRTGSLKSNATDLVLQGPSAAVTDAAGVDALGGFATNSGTLTVVDRVLDLPAPAFTNTGTLEIGAGGVLQTPSMRQTAGTTTVLAGGTLRSVSGVDLQGGALAGSGTVDGPLTNRGTQPPVELRPGGELAVLGSYTQAATGVLVAELGAGTGLAQRQLNATGDGALNGTLRVSLADDFVPVVGARYVLATFQRRTGTFSVLEVEQPEGAVLVPYYTANGVGLQVQAA